MQAFLIKGGDIQLGPGGYAVVEGEAKLKQDLAFALEEPVGTDRFHPLWGSMLPIYIGSSWSPESFTMIQSETSRVVANYLNVQQREIQRDLLNGLKSRYTDAEVLTAIGAPAVQQNVDRIAVKIPMQTRANGSVVLVRSIEG